MKYEFRSGEARRPALLLSRMIRQIRGLVLKNLERVSGRRQPSLASILFQPSVIEAAPGEETGKIRLS